ncbi:protein kinase [Hassallia byssoidea VB512170]|uniref:Protein kinase n=1 Tax=Hassallia byssoidea VB512170 TaxID=1304833 RepID=A0A846HCS9_9CYAN|nr:serine/threonine-protein kinase [Hassalia byssoidea]NEU74400.1 protein kinase [Hassalia byssoidea VB512170]
MQLWTPNQPLQNKRFIIKQVLASGGFGVTYSAQEKQTGKIFVIKTLNQQQQTQVDFQQRQVKFVNEALRLAQCSHPHIVKVHEVIQEDELWGIVMEYIDGLSLEVYVDERGQLPENEALRYIDQVGKALEYVHQQGFLHRDIKPNNILLRRDTQEAVLIDFGLAREFIIGQIKSMTNARTEGYAPIEQYERRGNGTYTDVYALAATLYTLLTGVVPIPAAFRKYAQLPQPLQHNDKISNFVNDAIVKGMALEPQERSQTIREFRELLGIATIELSDKIQPTQLDILPSNVDFAQLEDLLKAKQWKQADRQTYLVMLQAVDRHKQGWMKAQELSNFPCAVLRKIDQLWKVYSDGKFGLSIQQQIWRKINSSSVNLDIATFCEFGNCVGWRKNDKWLKYDNFTFSLESQKGHLPSFGYGVQRWDEWQSSCWHLFPRINNCL